MRNRIVAGLCAVSLIVPLVISLGGLAFSFIPVLRDGVQPTILFMAAAAGLSGVFFFIFLFGAPAAFLVATVGYAFATERLRRDPPLALRWALLTPAALGLVLLPPVFVIGTAPDNPLLRFLGPAVLGGVAGASAGGIFWAIAIRHPSSGAPMRNGASHGAT
jgi:hypothetical protein